jgi:hypothetical protein
MAEPEEIVEDILVDIPVKEMPKARVFQVSFVSLIALTP